jgi:hypothetical protein
MSTALLTPKSISPLFKSGRNVLVPVYGWTVIWKEALSLTALEKALATA